jgi:hypothetical protein
VKKRATTAKKEAKRRVIAKGVLTGRPTRAMARATESTPRTVQRIRAEPETQFLITRALRPQRKNLTDMAARAVRVVLEGFEAIHYVKVSPKKYKRMGDAIARLRAVERYGELLQLAQGGKPEAQIEAEGARTFTWEEFTLLYRSRKRHGKDNTDSDGAEVFKPGYGPGS